MIFEVSIPRLARRGPAIVVFKFFPLSGGIYWTFRNADRKEGSMILDRR